MPELLPELVGGGPYISIRPEAWTPGRTPKGWGTFTVCVATYGQIAAETTDSLVWLVKHDTRCRGLLISTLVGWETNRQRLVEMFLANPAYGDWFLSVDSDVAFDSSIAARLSDAAQALKADIVAAPYSQTNGDLTVAVIDAESVYRRPRPQELEADRAYRIDATALGMTLVRRSILERMREAFAADAPFQHFQATRSVISAGAQVAIDADWRFCARAAECGARVFALTVPVGHRKSVTLTVPYASS